MASRFQTIQQDLLSKQHTWLVTGCAGFIGFHLAKKRLEMGDAVVGVDNLNDYYDVSLKEARLQQLLQYDHFTFEKLDIADRVSVPALFKKYCFNKKTRKF